MNSPRIPVVVGLGANLGDPVAQLAAAVDSLMEIIHEMVVSDIFRTEPVGIRDQPDFYNLTLQGITSCTVYDLHGRSQRIEREMGRVRGARNGPRVIDIDLLGYGELVLVSDQLTVPHPRLHERSFVLAPLAEIAPEWRHPILGRTAGELLEALPETSAITRWGALSNVIGDTWRRTSE